MPRNILWLLIGLTGLGSVAWLTNSLQPTPLTIIMFLTLVFGTVTCFSLYIIIAMRHSWLIACGTVGWLLLRYFELREPFYIILWIACLVSLELYRKIR